eukprot:Hpha_TRINITY_DN27727_c0_g1::TRINITY_DN27727_c0_g1_i1::g.157149::m.157149
MSMPGNQQAMEWMQAMQQAMTAFQYDPTAMPHMFPQAWPAVASYGDEVGGGFEQLGGEGLGGGGMVASTVGVPVMTRPMGGDGVATGQPIGGDLDSMMSAMRAMQPQSQQQQPKQRKTESSEEPMLCVGFVGMGPGCAEVANSVANRPDFTDESPAEGDPQSVLPVQCYHCEERSVTHVYLPSGSLCLADLQVQVSRWQKQRAASENADVRSAPVSHVDWLEDRQVGFLRGLLYVFSVCHVVLIVNRGLQVDLGLFRLLRLLHTMKQSMLHAFKDLSGDAAWGYGFASRNSPARLLPIVGFVFAARRNDPALQVAEQRLEAQVRSFARASHLSGSHASAERDGVTPLMMLDPQRCAFVVCQPFSAVESSQQLRLCLLSGERRTDRDRGGAAGVRGVGPLREFIGRQQNYLLRQADLPTAEQWAKEQAHVDTLTRLDNKLMLPDRPVIEHGAFRRLPQMLNPLYKFSYQRCVHAQDCALAAIRSFLSGVLTTGGEEAGLLLDSAARQHQWQRCSSVFASQAIGPLTVEISQDTKAAFEKQWARAAARAERGAAGREEAEEVEDGAGADHDTRYEGGQS